MGLTDDALALAFRTGLPFVGLRDHAHNPELDRRIPPDAARAARAIPLGANDDHIRLAVADPDTDLTTLAPYLTDLRVDLALAPREEIDAILGPPLPESDTEADPEAIAAEREPPAPSEAGPEPPAAADADAEADPFAAEPDAAATAEPDPLTAEPDPLAAEPEPHTPPAEEPQAGTEGKPQPLAAKPEPPAAPAAEEPEAATAEPDLLAPEAEPTAAAEPGADALAAASLGSPDDELAGEVPSWLEPPRRRRRVVVAVLIVIFVLVVAAAVVFALMNA